MRGVAATYILALGAGCGGLATNADAPPGTIDGAPTRDGGPPDAAGCSYTCYAPSLNGQPSAIGTAQCRQPTNACQPALAWLESIDLCGCSLGAPALYVLPTAQNTAHVALVAPPSPTGFSVSLTDPSGLCYGSGACLDPAMQCGNLEVSAWVDVGLGMGEHRFTIFDDDGQGCMLSQSRYTFILGP